MAEFAIGEPPYNDGASVVPPSLQATANLERYLAGDPAFQGIGVKRARDLAERFGAGLHAALAGQDEAVAEIVGEERAAALFVAYSLKLIEADIVAWLDEHGIAPTVGLKMVRCWGEMGAARLKQNPFLLIGFLGWRAAEHVAERLRVRPDDPRRLVAAVEAVLYSRLDNGHTWTSRADLEHGVRKFLLSHQLARKAPDVAVEDMGAIRYGGGYQPAGASAMEQFCARVLRQAIDEPLQYDLVAPEITPTEIYASLQAIEAHQGFSLTVRQRDAVHMVLTSRVSLLGGYAGSGKTSVLRAVCDVAEAHGRVMYLMALSGKAARRITEATKRSASTIASFLKRAEERAISLGPETIIVVDEASMIDLTTLYRLLRRIGSGRLLMVGDPAQLPPIGFGNPFHTLIAHPSLPCVVLDRVLRQTAESGIPAVAAAIRNGRMPTLQNFTGSGSGVSFIDCYIEQAVDLILSVGRTLASEGVSRDSIQIITPIRAGNAGINAINHHFHQLRAPGRDHFPGRNIAEGDPVIWLTNDYERDLQNGSTGRFLGLDKECRPKVELDGRMFTMKANDGANLDLAYSISVHKSQGSQWPRVIVPVFPSRILDRTLAYTAITRASEQVILLGDRSAFQRAIEATAAVERRQTCLGARFDNVISDARADLR